MDDFFKHLPAPPGQVVRTANPRRKLYIWLGGVGGFLLVFGIAVALVLGARRLMHATQAPMTALNAYTGTLIGKDYKKAYAMTADEYRSNSSYDEFLQFQTKLADRFGALKGTVQNGWNLKTQDDLTTCTVRTELQFERGTAHVRFILLEGKDQTWRVLSFQEISDDSDE